jgi:hypothetical protein
MQASATLNTVRADNNFDVYPTSVGKMIRYGGSAEFRNLTGYAPDVASSSYLVSQSNVKTDFSAFTIAFWLRATSTDSNNKVIVQTGNTYFKILRIGATTIRVFINNNLYDYTVYDADSVWHFYVVTVLDNKPVLYKV